MKHNKIFWLIVILTSCLGGVYNVGYYHPDEHWQILEFAGYWWGRVPEISLPWEYHHQMRPALQPMLAYIVGLFSEWIYGEYNPFFWTLILRFLSALFSIFSVYQLSKVLENEIDAPKLKNYLWLFSYFSWFLLFLHVRFSSEGWSASAWILGVAYILKSPKENHSFFIAGIWLGLAFVFRYQLGFAILGVILWLILLKNENKFFKLFALSLGGLSVIILSTILDSVFYGRFVLAPYNYFYENLILKKVSTFGKEPWYFYLAILLKSQTFLFNLVYLICSLYFIVKYPKHLITWTVIPFVLIHLIIKHKEDRFLFPLLNFVPFWFIKTLDIEKLNIFEKYKYNFLKIWFIIQIPFSLKVVYAYLQPQLIMYELAWKYDKEPVILYFREYPREVECDWSKKQDHQNQCLKHNVYLKSNIKIWYYCPGDRIALDTSKYSVALIEFYDFREKKNIPQSFKRVYSYYPEWVIKYLNFGGWVQRTSFLEIYEYRGKN
jgi:phosphatidylinositol glycan class B